MKVKALLAAAALAVSTPALAANTKAQDNAAMATVVYVTAKTVCNLSAEEDRTLKGMSTYVIEGSGFSWDEMIGNKTYVGPFLVDHPIYMQAVDRDPIAVGSVCGAVRAMIANNKGFSR